MINQSNNNNNNCNKRNNNNNKEKLDTMEVPKEKSLRSSSQTNISCSSPFINQLSLLSPGGHARASTISIARKHSLPPVMDLFLNPKQSYMTFAEFKRIDENPRQQRAILISLQRQENDLKRDGVIKEMNKAGLKGKKERKISKTMEFMNYKTPFPLVRRSSTGAVALKFLGIKKGKKKTSSVLLNNLLLAIRDHKTSDALTILRHLSGSSLRKKRFNEANRAFLMAMAHRMEDVALTMYERGIPGDVNSPIFVKQTKNAERGSISGVKYPSYFILSVALGLYNLTQSMLKRANMNQTWFGLSPLLIATAQATQTSYVKSTSDATLLIKIFLEHGADPSQGLPYEQFNMLRRLKSEQYTKRLDSVWSFKVSHKSNQRQFGSARLDAERVKEEMRIFAKDKWVTPLDIAAASDNIEIVRMLLSRMDGSSVSKSSFCLSTQHDIMLTLELVRAGANVNQRDFRGNTALHRATRSGHIEVMTGLLRLGADVNARGENDWTPLHEAISQKHINACPILISSGADVELKNDSGKTARELGLACGLTKEQIDQCLDTTGAPNLQKTKQQQQNGQISKPTEKTSSPISLKGNRSRTLSFQKKSYHGFNVLMKTGDRNENKTPNAKY